MLKTVEIDKSFGGRQVLEGISLELEGGHIFGLLGTNGAGKSTLLRIISGILQADRGEVYLGEQRVFENPAAKAEICYLSDDPTFLHAASIQEMGAFQRAWYPTHDPERLKELCKRFDLPMEEKISGFSKGTQKRVQVCLALARRPQALLCDETFDGLDPVMREAFRKTISEETWDRGMMTILAGHNQQEMEDICDSVGFLHQGRLTTVGDMESVVSGIFRVQFATAEPIPEEELQALHPLRSQRQGRLCVVTLRGDQETALRKIATFGPEFCEALPLTLEEVFILEMEEQGYAQ
ncbi:MAG: ABC transporter ATP-binding protein [Clostridia bacterium]|nr:ABC transporter ATP-binding protein [Clostridia bacterium]